MMKLVVFLVSTVGSLSNHKTGGFLDNRMTPNCRCRGKSFEASPRFKPPHQTLNGWEKIYWKITCFSMFPTRYG